MNKNIAKRLTFQDLIDKKIKLEESKIEFKEIYVNKVEGNLLFKVPKIREMLKIIDIIKENNNSIEVTYDEFKKIIYFSCEILHNKELQQAYEIIDPFDIVEIFIDTEQIIEIGNLFMALTGVGENVNIDEEVKN